MPPDNNDHKSRLAEQLKTKLDEAVQRAEALRAKQDRRIDAIDNPDLKKAVLGKRLSFAR
jgi:hypothetical protein